MSSEFMPMALDSLARQQSARAAGSGASSRITEEELEELGIPVNKPGENDMGLDFNDFLQLMVQQLQNQTIDNTTDTGEMLNQLVRCPPYRCCPALRPDWRPWWMPAP